MVGGVLALDRGDLWYRHVVRRQAQALASWPSRPTCRASCSSRSTGSPTTCCAARCATATRPCSRAGCTTAATGSSAGRPTGPRRPAPARPGCCTATTTTCPRSAGGRRTRGRAIVTNHPRDAAEIERRHSNGRGLLYADGASRANILSGDAPHSMLTMSTVLDRDRPGRLGQDYFAYFASPYGVARTLLRVIGEVVVERWSAIQQVRRDVRPRIHRGWEYALVRAYATVDPARPAGRGGHRRRARRAARGLHDVPGLRRGRAPLGRRAAGHARGAAPRRPRDRPDRRRASSTRRGRTGSSCSPTTARARARRSASATARASRTSSRAAATATCGPRTRTATRRLASLQRGVAEVATRDTRDGPRGPHRGRQAARARPEPDGASIPRGLGDGLGQPRADLLPARAGPRHARADRRAPPRAGGRAALAPRDRVRARALRAPSARSCSARAASACCATTRVEGDDPLAPFGPFAADHVRRTDGFAALPGHRRQQPATGRSWRRSPRSRSSSARTAAWAAARRTRSCCTRRDLPWPAEPVVGAATVHRILRGWLAQLGPGRRTTTRRWSAAPSRATRSSATRRGRASPRASTVPARRRDARTPAAARVRSAVAAAEADRQERAPVDRDRDPRLDSARRPCAAPSGSRWPGPSDGPQPQIGISATSTSPCSARMLSLRSVSPANQTPSTRKPSVSSSSARGPGGGGRRARRARRGSRCRRSRSSRRPAPPRSRRSPSRRAASRRRRAARRWCRGPRAPQRRLVEVVVVQVRDQHAVEHAGVRRVGPAARQVRDAAAQHGVGEQARAGGLEQHGGVPEPGDRHPARAAWRAHVSHVEILRMSLWRQPRHRRGGRFIIRYG